MNELILLRLFRTGVLLLIASGITLAQALIPAELAKAVSRKFAEAKQYAFEGDLEIARKSGTYAPAAILETAKLKFAVAPGGKCLLEIKNANKPAYILISNGETSWAYVPTLKKYTEQGVSGAFSGCDEPVGAFDNQPDRQQDLGADFARRVQPILAGLTNRLQFADLKGQLLSVILKKDERDRQEMTYLTLDTSTLEIRKMTWLLAAPTAKGDKELIRVDLKFASFRFDESVRDMQFIFTPPKSAKRVKSLPIGLAVGASKRR